MSEWLIFVSNMMFQQIKTIFATISGKLLFFTIFTFSGGYPYTINAHHFIPSFFGKVAVYLDSKIILTVNQMLITASESQNDTV